MDKLEKCLKMMEILKKEKFKFLYDAGNQGPLPIAEHEGRFYKEFILYKDGSLEYNGRSPQSAPGGYRFFEPSVSDITISGLKPTDAIVNFAYLKLKKICFERAREQVMQRLIEHQVKLAGLDFLLQPDDTELH